MKAFRIKYKTGEFEILYAENALACVKKYDLAGQSMVKKMESWAQLSGEQEAIALANREDV